MKQKKNGKRGCRPLLRLALLAPPAFLIALYFALRSVPGAADRTAAGFSAPVRHFLGALCGHVSFSVMELFYAAVILWLLVSIGLGIAAVIRSGTKWKTACCRLLTIVLVFSCIWAAYCWLWGIDYYGESFAEKSGLTVSAVSTEDLTAVTKLFAEKANAFSTEVNRDSGGHFTTDVSGLFARSVSLYAASTDETFPCLAGTSFRPKAMVFSRLMSAMGFTGIYFPFTGESNINTDQPECMLPFTVAHELAHQRGVTAEQEANFIGVYACVTSGDAEFAYSGWLSGLVYLSNALYQADGDACGAILATLSPAVQTDLADNNAYWANWESAVTTASEKTYDVYLKANGQTSGIRSYGECVDLLVTWFSKQA